MWLLSSYFLIHSKFYYIHVFIREITFDLMDVYSKGVKLIWKFYVANYKGMSGKSDFQANSDKVW